MSMMDITEGPYNIESDITLTAPDGTLVAIIGHPADDPTPQNMRDAKAFRQLWQLVNLARQFVALASLQYGTDEHRAAIERLSAGFRKALRRAGDRLPPPPPSA